MGTRMSMASRRELVADRVARRVYETDPLLCPEARAPDFLALLRDVPRRRAPDVRDDDGRGGGLPRDGEGPPVAPGLQQVGGCKVLKRPYLPILNREFSYYSVAVTSSATSVTFGTLTPSRA